MSQGDYIQLKKTKNRLCIFNAKSTFDTPASGSNYVELNPVLSSQDYTDFASFQVASTVVNTQPLYSCLDFSGQTILFGIPQALGEPLPPWTLCQGTDERANRVLDIRNGSSLSSLIPGARPLTQKAKDMAQHKTGYPFWTTASGAVYKWPGDNRVKTEGLLPPCTPVVSLGGVKTIQRKTFGYAESGGYGSTY
jgi:hypothetical protein